MTDPDAARVIVVGPASWNHLIELDQLPEPTPHMQFARRSLHTVGGTSAGKALHLRDLGVDVELHCLLGQDDDGRRIRAALAEAGVRLHAHPSTRTERHVNLMTSAGERVSIYVDVPSPSTNAVHETIERSLASADVAILDLSELGSTLIERREWAAAVWVDLHDYDGRSRFHEPFVRAADVVFMNADRTDDPWALLTACLTRGPRVAVCTLGAQGAIALDHAGHRYTVDAVPTDVVDTNGAGDAFMAGFLHANLAGADIAMSLSAGAKQATAALQTMHLHPSLDVVLSARER